MTPPSQRQELGEDGLPEMMSLQDLEDSRHLSREFQRLELKMAKKAARQHARDRSEPYGTKHKRFGKDKYGLNQSFSRRAVSHLDEEISPTQAYAKGGPKSDPRIERSLSPKADKKHTNATETLGGRSSRDAADVCVSRAAEPAPERPHMKPEAPRRGGTPVGPDVGMHDFAQAGARSPRRR
ncbi:MAG: hypothetical protein JF606_21780 [Burkholderiales bacterium]|nr:hypothetical protein [Burkholderiales bacterium]